MAKVTKKFWQANLFSKKRKVIKQQSPLMGRKAVF
jgi:hypothetical protein